MVHTIVFMGSPDFAVPTLNALYKYYSIVGVITQPDRGSGRGRKLSSPPVKKLAVELGLPVIQPDNLAKDQDAKNQLLEWNPDLIVVTAFGQILKKDVLDLAPFGCINVHASLLPKWRGVSPIQAVILHGEEKTGITIMRMDEGIDTGDILHQCEIPIRSDETGGSLSEKLAKLGGKCILEMLPAYLTGKLKPIPQGNSQTEYAPKIRKTDGELDFTQPAETLEKQIRAYYPWPGCYTFWQKEVLKIHKAHIVDIPSPGVGVLSIHNGYPAIGTQEGLLVIDQLQPAGKKSMTGEDFLRGSRNWGE